MKKEHYEILMEDMNGKFDLVLEGFQGLHNEIVRTREELREEIKLNTIRIEALSDRVDSVEENLGNRIDAVDEKLSARIDDVDKNLSNRIDSVEKNLNTRIDAVEENLSSHIDAVATDLKAHRADTEIHHGVYRVKEKTEG